MRELHDRVNEQHAAILRCKTPEDYGAWLAKYRPDLLALFPERVQVQARKGSVPC